MFQTTLFYLISLAVVVFAIGVIASKSPVYSVLFLVATMCMTAGLFVLLNAFLVATILVLVYAGAILVLFLFVVMLIDVKKIDARWEGFKIAPFVAVFLGLIVFWEIFKVIGSIHLPFSLPKQGTAQAIGYILFNQYALPFELTSFLLLAAVVSIVVLASKKELK